VLGYFVEVAEAHASRLFEPPANATFFHRQTLASQVRFTTAALSDLEARIAGAAGRALSIEQAVFARHVAAIVAAGPDIRAAADALAELDVHAALAELAASEAWTRPVVDMSLTFSIQGGRHPVVEAALRRSGDGPFVANDCALGPRGTEAAGHVWLLTGPNMAGKSTFLRQNALIAILAQAGSFVPARAAHLGVVDRLFSRVGAADDLARGRSTFMVEMVETAAILTQASERSLVILDEIGRGTATFDGLSIAWATLEHLHDVNRCRALFATHFHELTALTAKLPRLDAATMKVKEWQGDVVFLHEVGPGAADRSYGIQVAKLAGLPAAVVARAREVLSQLEEGDRAPNAAKLIDDLPLFAARPPAPTGPARDPFRDAVAALDPDAMTPKEALAALYALKAMLADNGRNG
jgi:DNA mismatch repair protein MutS